MLVALALSAALTSQSFTLANPDFEAPATAAAPVPGWVLEMGAYHEGREPASTIALDTQVTHSGKASLRVSGDQKTRMWYAVKQEVPVRPEGIYSLKCFARAEGVRREIVFGTKEQQFENAYVGIVFLDAKNELVAEAHLNPKLPKSDWEELSMYQIAPPQTRRVQVTIFLSMTGTLWVDDLQFTLEGGKEPPPVRVLMKEGFETRDQLPAEWTREVGARTGAGPKQSQVTIDRDEDSGGSPRALKLAGDVTTEQWLGISRRFDCVPGDALQYRCQVKAKNVRREGAQTQNFYTGLVFIGADNRLVGAKQYAHGGEGTFDWKPLEVSGVAPEGAVAVMAGVFLSMSGEVWLDQLELTAQSGSTPAYLGWKTLETDHVTIRYPDDHPDKGRMEYYGTQLDNAYEAIHKALGLPDTGRVTTYVYKDSDEGRKITSQELDFSNPQARVIHQRFESAPGHELTHVIAYTMGPAGSDLMNEGLAISLDGTPTKEIHRRAAQYLSEKKLPALTELMTHYHSMPDTMAAAGSFAAYAFETLGLDRFKHLYFMKQPEVNAGNVVSGGLPSLEKSWHEYLKQQS
jgi:hypothetical protein